MTGKRQQEAISVDWERVADNLAAVLEAYGRRDVPLVATALDSYRLAKEMNAG